MGWHASAVGHQSFSWCLDFHGQCKRKYFVLFIGASPYSSMEAAPRHRLNNTFETKCSVLLRSARLLSFLLV